MDPRALNRALLARQGLLDRTRLDAVEAVERFGPLQAQAPRAPFVALWARVAGLTVADVTAAVQARTLVRATWARATLHLVSARDYRTLRHTYGPGIGAAAEAVLGDRVAGVDLPDLLAAATELFGDRALLFEEVRDALAERFPGVDVRAMGHLVRTNLPLVVAPEPQPWSWSGKTRFTLAERWIGPTAPALGPEVVVRRHLAAFGPATVRDLEAGTGLAGLAPAVERLGDELVRFAAGRKVWFDLRDAPRPPADTPAPPRLLPEFDSVLLSHADRTRIVADADRPRVYLPALRVAATFLVDGVVAGTWTLTREKKAQTVVLSPFRAVARPAQDSLVAEAHAVAAFHDPSTPVTVRWDG